MAEVNPVTDTRDANQRGKISNGVNPIRDETVAFGQPISNGVKGKPKALGETGLLLLKHRKGLMLQVLIYKKLSVLRSF